MSVQTITEFYKQHSASINKVFMVTATVLIYGMLAYQLRKSGGKR